MLYNTNNIVFDNQKSHIQQPMYTTLTSLIDRLDNDATYDSGVIRWGCPIPSFGDLSTSRIATVGINPSNREFIDEEGHELQGKYRRFHTLKSLGLQSWLDVDARHIQLIAQSCFDYFNGNPYDRWFKTLDYIISGAQVSYYDKTFKACHLDLIPYATIRKWTELSTQQHSMLLALASNFLGLLIRDSPLEVLILNGKTVVQIFQEISCVRLNKCNASKWTLPRYSSPDVVGIAYSGIINTISGIQLERNLIVLGFNHNLQGSFGVTKQVLQEIRSWISESVMELNSATK